jgi:flavin reductase (DIM6/NTAB) family NADH-FMN oxidoreductase RutF
MKLEHDTDLPLAERFRNAMRLGASGIAVLATDGATGRAGMTVSSFCSLSLSPPSVLACLERGSRTAAAVLGNRAFAVSVLSEAQAEIARLFSGPEDDRFERVAWQPSANGCPAIAGALAVFECRLAGAYTHATHEIVVGDVAALGAGEGNPLVYSRRRYGTFTPAR